MCAIIDYVSIKQRAYPDSDQVAMLVTHCDHARFLYNLGLDQRRMLTRADRRRGIRITAASQQRELTELRQEVEWLRQGSTVVQQGALRDLDRAFSHFFSGRTRFPTFRRRGGRQSFVVRDVSLRRYSRKWAAIRIPKAGWLRFRLSVAWDKALQASSARVVIHNGKWHVALTTPPREKRTSGQGVVGIDRGVAISVMTSEGVGYKAPTLTPCQEKRFVRLEQAAAKKVRGSKRYEITRQKLAEMRSRLNNRRTDWVEKTTTDLASSYACAVIEDLNVASMTSRVAVRPDGDGGFLPNGQSAKSGLNRVILASLWGKFARRLSDKVDTFRVPAAYTSQKCHQCGHTARENRESQAVFKCVSCGHTVNADLNAARNIRDALKPGDTGCTDAALSGVNLQTA